MEPHHDSNHHDADKANSVSDYDPSRSSGEGSDSTGQTPPSPLLVPIPHQLPVVEPQITMTTATTTTPTSSPKKPSRSPKRAVTPKSRLGAIDEDTDLVSPDVPVRNPRRILRPSSRLFNFAFPPTLYNSRAPPGKLWDDVEGPNGEKFTDLRNNQKSRVPGGRRRGFICCALFLLSIGVIVMIILLAVLLPRRNKNNNNGSTGNYTVPANAFPGGNYTITSYLTTTSTDCTSNAATWTCNAGETTAQSPSVPLTNLQWKVQQDLALSTKNKQVEWTISSADPIFMYPINSLPLTLTNKGLSNEAYTFNLTYNKTTFPVGSSLSSNGIRTRCFFNNTMLTGTLYTRMAKNETLLQEQNSTSTAMTNSKQWPYALEFAETIGAGNAVPDCYEYLNGANGARIDVPAVTVSAGVAETCECGYANYGS